MKLKYIEMEQSDMHCSSNLIELIPDLNNLHNDLYRTINAAESFKG